MQPQPWEGRRLGWALETATVPNARASLSAPAGFRAWARRRDATWQTRLRPGRRARCRLRTRSGFGYPRVFGSLRVLACSLLLPLLGIFGCIDTGLDATEVALSVQGTRRDVIVLDNGDELRLDAASLAFGPLYLCPGFQAGELCETAQASFVDSVLVDVHSDAVQEAGAMKAFTGSVASYMYDLGFSSLLTDRQSVANEAAQALGGHSFVARGEMRRADKVLPFAVEVVVRLEGEASSTFQGAPMVRSCSSRSAGCVDGLAPHELRRDANALTLRFDADPWFQGIALDAFFVERDCAPDGPPMVCQGDVAQRCAPDGTVLTSTVCDDGLVCVEGDGCTAAVTWPVDGAAARALQTNLQLRGRPAFLWDESAALLRSSP